MAAAQKPMMNTVPAAAPYRFSSTRARSSRPSSLVSTAMFAEWSSSAPTMSVETTKSPVMP
jgi:hypothetical protein